MTTFTPRYRPDRRNFLKATGIIAAGLTFLPRGALAEEEKKLNFYNWDTYIGENTLAQFQEASGIETKLDIFADTSELFAKLKGGNPGYDVIVPSGSWIQRMVGANMLMELDHSKIPNIANIDPAFMNPVFDAGRKHSLPYMWGTVGIGYRKSKIEGTPDSWKYFFGDSKYAGQISMLGDARNVIGAALKFLGYSLNSVNPAELKQAEELLIAQKKNIKVFAPDNGQDLLASGEVVIAQEWNGDVLQVMGEDDDIGYVLPSEGGQVWEDTLAIAAGAPHPNNAHAFINFLLDAKVGAEIAEFIQYGSPNAAAKKLTTPEYQNNPGIFPSAEALAKCEAEGYLGEEGQKLFEEAWTRIQAA
jgi:spermidine/putrescine transport system substrate-binding protein